MKPLIWLSLPILALVIGEPTARADDPPPIEVMIVGTYHFANPGRDLHNVEADDVTTPWRQKELAELAARLERFKPTRVAIETVVSTPDMKLASFRAFTPADLAKNRNERTQVGFRIARDAGLAEVYGIDETSETIDYFPFGKVVAYAKQHGGDARLAAMQARVEAMTRKFSAGLKTRSISALFAELNEPATIRLMQAYYYDVLAFGDAASQPGADLNAGWYQRNAKIFAKLTQIARPGDRVIVVFGSGHAFWLRHFVEHTSGYVLVEPNRYLTGKQ